MIKGDEEQKAATLTLLGWEPVGPAAWRNYAYGLYVMRSSAAGWLVHHMPEESIVHEMPVCPTDRVPPGLLRIFFEWAMNHEATR
jgi:hypothetical protein